ncbi:acyl-CoA dehydrogenase family protein [Sphingopyxis granuli]|uniref:Pimeloyl-CoA dehydrogenase small subunit-like protein n=2 Tax=Sphingopyxis TaxID=165697 RepID=D9PTM9_SPHMC|nr:acyl-CoA dehydrogenase [Sphingopyxis granuli]ADK93989.1 pimeloyl-CoA dehydrogenase small subunit-like protein [Sphingopyxis macrogoltabida]AMG75139.1 Pimeloyl-CoA dehydrogenase small subunit-like protein [Sphingopyxis granuli]
MNFDLNDEQRMVRDSVERLMADAYDFESRRRFQRQPAGYSTDIWSNFAELGLLGLPVPEEYGGFGGGPAETMIIMETLGRALSLEPYFAGIVLPAALLRHAGNQAVPAEIFPAMATGELLLGVAHGEPQARYDLHDVATNARQDGDGYVLNGCKSLVLHGEAADRLLVSARIAGERASADGIGLFLVDAKADGIVRKGGRMPDGMRVAEVRFDDVRVPAHALVSASAAPTIDAAFDEALAAICAEAIGVMDEALRMTVEYLKDRKQFGVPLGSFQALQHRAADMYIALEQARSMVFFALMNLEEPPATRRDAVFAAKVQINESARVIGEQAVQLHGGIGMTEEYKLGHLFKRLTVIGRMFADTEHCLDHLSRSRGLFNG